MLRCVCVCVHVFVCLQWELHGQFVQWFNRIDNSIWTITIVSGREGYFLLFIFLLKFQLHCVVQYLWCQQYNDIFDVNNTMTSLDASNTMTSLDANNTMTSLMPTIQWHLLMPAIQYHLLMPTIQWHLWCQQYNIISWCQQYNDIFDASNTISSLDANNTISSLDANNTMTSLDANNTMTSLMPTIQWHIWCQQYNDIFDANNTMTSLMPIIQWHQYSHPWCQWDYIHLMWFKCELFSLGADHLSYYITYYKLRCWNLRCCFSVSTIFIIKKFFVIEI